MSRSYDIAVRKRDVYASARNGSSYKNLIQGNVIFVKCRTSTKEGQCISVNDRVKKNRKLAKWGGVPKTVRKRLEQKLPNVNVNTEIEVDVTSTTKRRASQAAKKNKNSKRRRSATTKAPALEPSAGGSCTHCSALYKHVQKQIKKLSHVVKELAAVRKHVEQQRHEMKNIFAGLRAFITLEIGSVRTKLDMQKNLVSRVLARGQTHTKVMQSIYDKLDP